MFIHLKDLFPEEDIHYSCLHPNLNYSSGRQIELDVFIPSMNIAFEYQGKQHYDTTISHYIYSDAENLKGRDVEKREICRKAGISLIEIPYWMQLNKQNLKQLIETLRPDIFSKKLQEINSASFSILAKPDHWIQQK